MRIWKLSPLDPSAPIWQQWSPEPVIVRATDEAEARDLAERTTIIERKKLAQKYSPIVNPWGRHHKIGEPIPTVCDDVTDEVGFLVAGSAIVLRHGEH